MIRDILAGEQRLAIERWCRDRARAIPMPNGKTLCRVLGEHPMVVDLNDLSVAPHLAMDGYWEIWLAMCMARRLRPGWRCIDVGANLGYFSIVMALITGAEVEAWEPMEDLGDMFVTTMRMNGLDKRVRLNRRAAGEKEEARPLYRNTGDYGSASLQSRVLSEHAETPHGHSYNVTVSRIERGTNLPVVDFIKIDAEGFEPEIWRGMAELFARKQPQALLMEWAPKRYEDPGAFLADIRKEGFNIHIVDGAGELQAPVGNIAEIDGHHDLWLSRS